MADTTTSGGAQPLRVLLQADEQRRTAHEFVRDTLRRAILSGRLAGGTRLVQAEIAAQLNVSTTPVREALRELAADGLIRFDPHRGGIVNTTDTAEFLETYEIRKLLEPHAMRRAAERISDTELGAAEKLADEMEREDDPGAWAELNWRFHRLLVLAAGSPRLDAILSSLQDSAALYVAHSLAHSPGRIMQGNHEHRGLLQALRDRDPAAAAAVVLEHLEGTLTAFSQETARAAAAESSSTG